MTDNIIIKPYTKDRISDVIAFELALRQEEDFWGWEIDEAYRKAVHDSFSAPGFENAVSFLAYLADKVVGRIDACIVPSHFDGSRKAYLDWICVLKSCRHRGVAQALMNRLRSHLTEQGIRTLVGLIAANEEAQRFYRSLDQALIRDEGIWIDLD